MSFRLIVCLVIGVLMAACASGPGAGGSVIDSGERYAVAASGGESYELGAGDKVRVTVFNEPTLSGEFAVSTTGELSLPLVGGVPAMGKQPAEVAAEYQRRLAEGYLREPRVSAEVTTYRPFFILGEVKAPGQYPYASGLTLLNAVATAQGYTPRANRGIVFVRRAGSTDEQAFRVAPDLRIWPGDTIRVGERYF